MKCLIIGGNRFVGLRLSHALDQQRGLELHILNRTGFVPHVKDAVLHKGDRRYLHSTHLDRDWDLIFDFACFTQSEAEGALAHFQSVKRYIFISSVSIYDEGAELTENLFDAKAFDLNQREAGGYQDGKRRAEAVFAQKAGFPVLTARFPFLLGPDDYSSRLEFHVQRTLRGEPIYIPNPAARISMLHAQDAADFLLWAMNKDLSGPLNVASTEPIALKGLMAQIELLTGKKPFLAKKEGKDNRSPYAPERDWFYSTKRMNEAGFKARPITSWLPELIPPVDSKPSGYVH